MMKAKFKGEPYKGWVPGEVYDIETKCGVVVMGQDDPFTVYHEPVIRAMDVHSGTSCPYSSAEAFLKNWEPISMDSKEASDEVKRMAAKMASNIRAMIDHLEKVKGISGADLKKEVISRI